MPVSVPPQSDDALSLGAPSGVKVLPSASLSHLFFLPARSLAPSQRNGERLPYYIEETSRSCFFSVLHLADIGAHKPFFSSLLPRSERAMSVKRTNENHLSQKILYLRNMEFIIPSIDRIDETAREFAAAAQFDDKHRNVFAFYGKMGAGKTTFIKALCDVLGVDDVVNSPTFAIVNEYHSGVLNDPVFHFDFYRIKHVDEAFDIGTDDYFYSGAPCFIEWPELIEPLLPDNAVRVDIEELPDGTRRVVLAD